MRGVRPRSSAHDTKRTTSGTNRPPARLRQRYRCVMIPPHEEESGNLPPGLHLATWGEVASRFGGSERRLDLLAGLKQALLSLRSAGCRQAYLDGSFVTTKEAPGDFDACWEASGHASRLDSALLTFANRRAAQKSKFGGELFPAESAVAPDGTRFLEYFQRDSRTGEAKGIVAIELSTL